MRSWISLLLVAVASCQSAAPAPLPPEGPGAPLELFQRHLKEEGTLLFRSWDGHYQGTDCDWDLQFLPEGRLHGIQYGEGIFHHRGTYRMDDHGAMDVSFDGISIKWPVMVLDRDARSLLLRPKESPYAGPPFEEPDFWTFRRVPYAGREHRSGD